MLKNYILRKLKLSHKSTKSKIIQIAYTLDYYFILFINFCRACFTNYNDKYPNPKIINLSSLVTFQRDTRLNHDRYIARITGRTIHLNDAVLVLARLCDMYTACA